MAALLPADDLAHAVRLTNSVPYDNSPSSGVDFHLPFGGVKAPKRQRAKASSHGHREQGRSALDFRTASRTYTPCHPLEQRDIVLW
ncbi:hypothetical protein [Streptomyces flavidovirens]|uniref:hypothetical protein n=1 Tax=Streptomyces flavidovirens TaxID=67298 RepID=UPI00041B97DF|nr:hypothetical protein [Streptomyces flavidovirens]